MSRSAVWLRFASAAAVILLCALTHPGWRVEPLESWVEPSWQAVLDHAARERWVFGRQIVFTFGPYGFLHSTFADTAPVRIAATTALTILLSVSILRFLLRTSGSWAASSITALAVWALAGATKDGWLYLMVAAPWLVCSAAWCDGSAGRPAARFDVFLMHAWAVGLAALSLSKYSLLIASVAVLAPLALASVRSRPAWAWPGLTYLVAFVALWMAAGQPIGALPEFLYWGFEATRGYDGMAVGGSVAEIVPLVAAALLLAIAYGFALVVRAPLRLGLAVAWLGFLFLLFKSAAVGLDPDHVVPVTSTMQALGLLLVPWCIRRARELAIARAPCRSGRSWSSLAAVCACAVGTFVAGEIPAAERGDQGSTALTQGPGRWRERVLRTAATLRDANTLAASWDGQLEALRREHSLPAISGTVDMFSHDQSLAIAYRLDYRPRPVFQSYAAYTPRLLELNRDAVVERPADFLLFQLTSLDTRLPTLFDSLCLPEILGRYDLIGGLSAETSEHLFFQRSPAPRPMRMQLLSVQDVPFDRDLQLPAVERGHVLWARVRFAATPLGSVRRLLWISDRVFVRLETRDGGERMHRLVPDVCAAGFILSPYLSATRDFLRLIRTSDVLWTRNAVHAVRFESTGAGTRYRDAIHVELFDVDWIAHSR